MVELTQQAEFESMIKFNASTGEEYCDMIDLSVVSVVPKSLSDIKQVGFTVSSLFFPRRLLRIEVILNTLNTLRQKKNDLMK